MNSNVCLGCRSGSVKIEISVAQKCKPEDFSHQTRDFGAGIIRVTGHKPIHYSLELDSGQNLAEIDFNVDCSSILNINKNDYSKFNVAEDRNCRVKHLQHLTSPSREPNIEVTETV
jgi:hypothetical protein